MWVICSRSSGCQSGRWWLKSGNVHVVEVLELIADYRRRLLPGMVCWDFYAAVLRAMGRIRGLRRLLQLRVVRGVAAHAKLLQLNVRCRGCKTVRCWAVEDCVSRPTVCRADRRMAVKRESNSFPCCSAGRVLRVTRPTRPIYR
jgi:hypothetical protein